MVIHIVNGFEPENTTFLLFIRKSKQLHGLVLTGKNQEPRGPARRPVQDTAKWLARPTFSQQISRILLHPPRIVGEHPHRLAASQNLAPQSLVIAQEKARSLNDSR